MSQEYFKAQEPHQHNGVDCYFILANLVKQLEVYRLPVNEIDSFLADNEFVHMSGLIPRFQKKSKKPDGNT